MADKTSDTPPPTDTGEPVLGELPEKSGSTEPAKPTATTRPVQVKGHYPVRIVTFFQISTSDLRSIGVLQAVTTVSAALGTFALSIHIDFSKDILLAGNSNKEASQSLSVTENVSFWAWLIFWAIALISFLWRHNELGRIKEEHNELTLLRRIKNKLLERFNLGSR